MDYRSTLSERASATFCGAGGYRGNGWVLICIIYFLQTLESPELDLRAYLSCCACVMKLREPEPAEVACGFSYPAAAWAFQSAYEESLSGRIFKQGLQPPAPSLGCGALHSPGAICQAARISTLGRLGFFIVRFSAPLLCLGNFAWKGTRC